LAAAAPVASAGGLVAFCPEDARLSYELWIAPTDPQPSFEDASPATVKATAEMLHSTLGAMNRLLDRPPYHLLLYTAPFQRGDGYCWRIESVPRLARIAGFELATGVFVNQTAPEEAAKAYRAVLG
jgi:UDPglucose--hexose-1-phosphate uridylyltransferase